MNKYFYFQIPLDSPEFIKKSPALIYMGDGRFGKRSNRELLSNEVTDENDAKARKKRSLTNDNFTRYFRVGRAR